MTDSPKDTERVLQTMIATAGSKYVIAQQRLEHGKCAQAELDTATAELEDLQRRYAAVTEEGQE